MHDYAALNNTELCWLAKGIGVYAADGTSDGQFAHIGDDAAIVAGESFRRFGADGAAEVLEHFLRGYNAAARAHGYSTVNINRLASVAPAGLSAPLARLTRDEIQEICTTLIARP